MSTLSNEHTAAPPALQLPTCLQKRRETQNVLLTSVSTAVPPLDTRTPTLGPILLCVAATSTQTKVLSWRARRLFSCTTHCCDCALERATAAASERYFCRTPSVKGWLLSAVTLTLVVSFMSVVSTPQHPLRQLDQDKPSAVAYSGGVGEMLAREAEEGKCMLDSPTNTRSTARSKSRSTSSLAGNMICEKSTMAATQEIGLASCVRVLAQIT